MFLVADSDDNVGDWIEWSGGGGGTIEAVNFRVTEIPTPDNETVSVPNTELTSNAITRPFGRNRYRITVQVYVAYNEDAERALMELQRIATNEESVLEDPAPTARIVELGENAVTVQAEFWIGYPARSDIVTVRSDFRRAVKGHFDEEGITLPPDSCSPGNAPSWTGRPSPQCRTASNTQTVDRMDGHTGRWVRSARREHPRTGTQLPGSNPL